MMDQYRYEIALFLNNLLVLGIMVYALLLMMGGLFGHGLKWANGFAIWTVKAPFRLLGWIFFGKKPKKNKKKKARAFSWL